MCTYPVQPVCTSLLFILLFIKSHILFLHILLVLHFSLFYCTFYSLFLFFTYIYICSCVVLLLYNFLLFCTVHWADLIWSTFHFWLYPVSFIMWQIKKPWTLNCWVFKSSSDWHNSIISPHLLIFSFCLSLSLSVCIWSSWSPSEGHRLQSDSSWALPYFPEPLGPVCRAQCHVCSHPAASSDHWGQILRQSWLLQTFPLG